MIDTTHIEALGAIVGNAGLVTQAHDAAPYETGARYDRGTAGLVVRPATTTEISAVVAYCVRHNIALVPQSGNTGLVSGSTPDASGTQVILSLDRVTAVFELDVANRSLRAGSGLRLSDVNRRLEPHGLHFPIDLGADPRLGGMIATNTGGSRFLKYGDVRHNMLGLTVVLADADGTVLEFGSGLRKNNTGIDWKQMFIGTAGAFGIVTQCEINLEPLPQQTATAFLVPADLQNVPALLLEMEARLGTTLSAFEGMSRNAVSAALDHVPSLRNPFPGGTIPNYVILAELSRSWSIKTGEQTLDAMLEETLADIFEVENPLLADAFIGPSHEMWALRHALSDGVKHKGRLIAFDLSFRRGDIMRFCEQMKIELPKRFPDVAICDFGHIGDGGVHFNLVVARDSLTLDPTTETRLRDWVFDVTVAEFGGSFSAEHAIGRKNQTYYDRYTVDRIKIMADGLKALTSPGPLGTVRFGTTGVAAQ